MQPRTYWLEYKVRDGDHYGHPYRHSGDSTIIPLGVWSLHPPEPLPSAIRSLLSEGGQTRLLSAWFAAHGGLIGLKVTLLDHTYCNGCERWLPRSEFHRDQEAAQDLPFLCDGCSRRCPDEQRDPVDAELPQFLQLQAPDLLGGMEQCRSCKQFKPYSAFHRDHGELGVTRHGCQLMCKECKHTSDMNRKTVKADRAAGRTLQIPMNF